MNTIPSQAHPADGQSISAHEFHDEASPQPSSLPERRKLVYSHPAYLRRQRCLKNKGGTIYEKAVKKEAKYFEERWLRSLPLERRKEVERWTQERVNLAVDEAYNQATDAGFTATAALLLDESIGAAVGYWQRVAMRYHQRVAAERAAEAATEQKAGAVQVGDVSDASSESDQEFSVAPSHRQGDF